MEKKGGIDMSQKLLKRMICFLLSVILFCGFGVSLYAEDISARRQRAIDFLLGAGWTIAEIDDLLSDKVLLEFAEAKAVVSSDKKYYRVTEEDSIAITEEECKNAINANKNIEKGISSYSGGDTIIDDITTTDGYLTYYVEVYSFGGGEYMISGRYEWLKVPLNTKIDVFSVSHDYQLTQLGNSDDVYYVYKADYAITPGNYITTEINTPDEMYISIHNGTAVKQKLLGATDYICSNHRGYLQYRACSNNTGATMFAVSAEYLHQQGMFSVSPSLSFDGMSVGVNYSTFFKRMSPNPYLSFSADF